MDFITHIKEAFTNLISAKLRSFLAILGVLVGTGSVVALISSSQLATAHALQQFKALGTNLLAMNLRDAEGEKDTQQINQFKLSDVLLLKKSSPEIVRVAPYTSLYKTIYFKGLNMSGQVLGTTGALSRIAKVDLQRGRFVSELDQNNYFCVIGSKVAKKIEAKGYDPMGKQILLGNTYFTVVGIAKPWQPNLFIFVNINEGVIIPLQASYTLSKEVHINDILLRLIRQPNLNKVQEAISAVFKKYLPQKEVHFRNPEQIIEIVGKQRKTFTWLLGAIGGISLLVGGIGVMNIMLVSVVERRKEIGIRMAIGARQIDILYMFLIESVILTVFGGILGIALGVGISYVIAYASGWEFEFFWIPPALGFVVSVFVGMISGFYPALRASKLDPIKTLQSD